MQAVVTAPDDASAAALAALLQSGHLLAHHSPAAAAGSGAGSGDGAATAPDSSAEAAARACGSGGMLGSGAEAASPLGSVEFSLSARAFAETVAPDEAQQRAWNRHLAALLPWLLPGHSAAAMPQDATLPLSPRGGSGSSDPSIPPQSPLAQSKVRAFVLRVLKQIWRSVGSRLLAQCGAASLCVICSTRLHLKHLSQPRPQRRRQRRRRSVWSARRRKCTRRCGPMGGSRRGRPTSLSCAQRCDHTRTVRWPGWCSVSEPRCCGRCFLSASSLALLKGGAPFGFSVSCCRLPTAATAAAHSIAKFCRFGCRQDSCCFGQAAALLPSELGVKRLLA